MEVTMKDPNVADSAQDGQLPKIDGTNQERSVRQAIPSDLPAIQEAIVAAYNKYLSRMDIPPAPLLKNYNDDIAAGMTWVIGDPVAGIITLLPQGGNLLIANVAVHPSEQGTGIGRQLMEFAEQEATRLSLTRLVLYTNESMVENQAIYRHLGYSEAERRTEDGYRRIYMEKSLQIGS
jgi:ribosomal protein S18 acetylase RimI-like enzyme